MQTYRKDILQSALELQQTLRTQVTKQLLQRQKERQVMYFTYTIAQFLAYLEILRKGMQDAVLLPPEAAPVQQLVKDIRALLAGEDFVVDGEEPWQYDEMSPLAPGLAAQDEEERKALLHLTPAAVHSIGSVMLNHPGSEILTRREPLRVDEFVRIMNITPLVAMPAPGAAPGGGGGLTAAATRRRERREAAAVAAAAASSDGGAADAAASPPEANQAWASPAEGGEQAAAGASEESGDAWGHGSDGAAAAAAVPVHLAYQWQMSYECKLQTVLGPLKGEVIELSEEEDIAAVNQRLAILQVLVCKLIDVLDPSVPWSTGPPFDPQEQPQAVPRDETLTPLVRYLSPQHRRQLASKPYFATTDPNLSFPGFRADLKDRPQVERDTHADLWQGACPPRMRKRQGAWIKRNAALGSQRQIANVGSFD